jgi:sulfur-oxidizing protein SoxA
MNSTKLKWAGVLTAVSMLAAGAAVADPDKNTLVIDGTELLTDVKAPAGSPLSHLYSGWRFRSPETQSLQMDDFENPSFTAVEQGEELWSTVEGEAGKSCASCHNDASESMKGVRASMPKWSDKLGKPHTLETRINACRTENMKAEAWKWEAPNMLAMTAYVGLQSRGMPVTVQTDGPMKEWADKGKELYYTRVGQLDMACSNCHEDNYGKMIRADHLSQGQINGFPVYRLKWGGLGSIHRRFSGCMKNIRATPYKRGSDEFIALELYLASRGSGLAVETPAVRN